MKIIELCQELTKGISPMRIYMNEPMKRHTSFKVGGNADIFVKVKNIEELKHVIKIAKKNDVHITIIGNGSNILVKDNGIRGIVVAIEFDNIDVKQEDNNAIVTVGAGVKLIVLAQEMAKKRISGLEFASGIPGTIGGAVRMNAGAYGGEMKDIIVSTKCLDLKKYNMLAKKIYIDDIEITENIEKAEEPEIIILSNEEQKFEYRNSIFKDKRYVILETKLKLKYDDKEKILERMEEINKQRKEKQPNAPSAGSTFKRGENYITAKLIDECGLKGYTIGGAQVSEKHAGFIVNKGDATAQDIIDLINYVKRTVYEKTGKSIELEIEILGD